MQGGALGGVGEAEAIGVVGIGQGQVRLRVGPSCGLNGEVGDQADAPVLRRANGWRGRGCQRLRHM